MEPLARARIDYEVDRERLIDLGLALVRNPRSAELQQALRTGPISVELFEVLALEGGTRRADVARVVDMLEGIEAIPRWVYSA